MNRKNLDMNKDSILERSRKRGKKRKLKDEDEKNIIDWCLKEKNEKKIVTCETTKIYIKEKFNWAPTSSWISRFFKKKTGFFQK